MTHNHSEFDELSYLLKKIEWPEPSHGLAYRIQNAPFAGEMNVVHFKSPFLTMMAVILAVFLSVAAGFATGGTASAGEVDHLYGSSSLSVTGIYSGQMR